jgi:hypothetical protein
MSQQEVIPARSGAARSASGNASLLLPCLVAAALAICSIIRHHGGALHPEVEDRLPYYLSHGSLLAKLYDSDYLDWGMYQARELSYLFDYVDCKFIAWSVALGHPHFLSLTHYVFLVLISLVLWRFGVVELKLKRWMALGVLLLFWTSPAVFLGGVFFRTAKIGVALTVVVLYWLVFRALRAARENPAPGFGAGRWLIFFGWAWAATLFDRQGVFMVGAALFFLCFWFLAYRERNTLKLIGALAAALALSVMYNYILAPLLTLWINNYWPDFHYQHLPWHDLVEHPVFFTASGISLYFDTVRFLFGGIPPLGAVLVVLALVVFGLATGARRDAGKPFYTAALGLILSQTVLIWVLITLMVLRHRALLDPALRGGSYYLPAVSMFSMTLLLLLSGFQTKPIWAKWCLALLLCGAILGNIAALPSHEATAQPGNISGNMEGLDPNYPSGPAVLDALRNLRNPRYVAPPEIARNRVFQFFHDGYFSKKPAALPSRNNKTTGKKN